MTDRLRILDELEAELTLAIQTDERAHTTRRRRYWARPHGLSLVLLLGGLSAATVAAAATHLFGLAAPVPAPRPGDAPIESRPIASTAMLAGLRSGDPGGLPAWDVRLSRSRTGEICTAVGQVHDGRFGIVGLDRRFRELPLGAADACGERPTGAQLQVGARAAIGGGALTPRTLVVGVAGPQVKQVTLRRGTRETPLHLGRSRAFLAVLTGLPETTRPHLRVTDRAGATTDVRLVDSGDVEVPDANPSAPPWAIKSGPGTDFVHPMARGAVAAPAGSTCVRGRQGLSSANFAYRVGRDDLNPPQTPLVCRTPLTPGPIVGSIRRLAPTGTEAFFYPPGAPIRTVAVGTASPDVVRLELRMPAGHRRVRIVPQTGAFLAILDGTVDPGDVELRARLRDGTLATFRGERAFLMGDDGRRKKLGPSPTLEQARAASTTVPAYERERVRGSERTGPLVPDPAGGPPWAARTWIGRGDRSYREGSRTPVELKCAAFGPVVDGVVREPAGRGAGLLAAEDAPKPFSAGCTLTDISMQAAIGRRPASYGAAAATYVDDPQGVSPEVVRVVVDGVYPGVVRAEVVGLPDGEERPATVAPGGAVLALLEPGILRRGIHLRLRLHFDDGRTVRTSYRELVPGRQSIQARAVDPKGGPPWVVRAARFGKERFPSYPERLIGERIGRIDERTGELDFSAGGSVMSAVMKPLTPRTPVVFDIAQMPDMSPDGKPSPADVARRTLPGRTLIYGKALRGVDRVTIRTPRDVRTVRPSAKGGVFVVAYDGRFTQGRIRVTATGPGVRGSAAQRADGQRESPPPAR